jgi:glycosyltransferase involved in cell wall biosynthesis
LKRIVFTVTNDLSFDQRMQRICGSLAHDGYDVCLVGRSQNKSVTLTPKPFQQKRISCLFQRGFLFYAEYNIKLFFYLLFQKFDCVCVIDLDTIIPGFLASTIKNTKRVYDAHELFCEMKEVATRPFIYKCWKWIERTFVPKFNHGYTVNDLIADEFKKMYGKDYEVIRSIAKFNPECGQTPKEKFLLYQGAVNEGRCFETLIPAMKMVDAQLIICGDGNFMNQAKQLVQDHQLQQKVIFKGMLAPQELRSITNIAYIGTTLCEKDSLSTYYSLANRFFDYLQSGTPQICVDFPVYNKLNNIHRVGVLVEDLSAESLAASINNLLHDKQLWQELHENCKKAALEWNWENEEKKLISFYNSYLG